MSDLISRSELLNAFNDTGIQITFDLPVEEVLGEDVDIDDFSMLVQDAIQAYKKMVIDTIKNQPTAYSVDKVVEELEKLQTYNMGLATLMSDLQRNGVYRHYICREDAIEIVRHGCVSDDVCKWEYNDTEYCLESSCNHLHIFMDDCPKQNEYSFCPYCGKKIKVVE